MGHLLDLQDNPLSWDELERRRAAYYAPPAPKPRQRTSGHCASRWHVRCRGLMVRDLTQPWDLTNQMDCRCKCHGK